MRRLSIKFITAVVFFILGITNIVICTGLSYRIIREHIEKRYYRESDIILDQLSGNISLRLKSAQDILDFVAGEYSGGDIEDIGRKLPAYSRLYRINNLILYSDQRGSYSASTKLDLPDYYNPLSRSWYRNAMENPGRVVWVDPFPAYDDLDIFFAASRTVDGPAGADSGVLSVMFDAAQISRELSGSVTGRDGYIMLLTSDGKIIANRESLYLGEYPFPADDLSADTGCRCLEEYMLFGSPCRVSIRRLAENGMYLVSAVSLEEIRTEIHIVFVRLFLVLFVVLSVFMLICYYFSYRSLKSLDRLVNLMQRAEYGDYSTRANFSSFKEIHSLSRSFNNMLSEIEKRDEMLKRRETKIRNMAYYDSLTELPNRTYFQKILSSYVRMCEDDHTSGALLYIDLDRFKIINDTMGHSVGDLVLKEVAFRLSDNLRKNQIAARIGGDEFVVLIQEIESPELANRIAGRVIDLLRKPVTVAGKSYNTGASIGIVFFPFQGNSSDVLLKKADMAMYKAKRSGRNTFQVYEENLEDEILRKISLEKGIRSALSGKQFYCLYQPQYHIESGRISGLEILLRHRSPLLGPYTTQEIITAAEENGLIIEIERWVLREACLYIRMLNQEYNQNISISVNISAPHLMQSDFIETVEEIISNTGVDRRFIEFEITETAVMESLHSGIEKLCRLREMGMKIHMDDFGTGYSSLNYLQKLPINYVKIDKTFIDNIEEDDRNRNIIALIIEIAHNLGLEVIAEGIETKGQLELLADYNCDFAQGYYLKRPVPAEEVMCIVAGSVLQLEAATDKDSALS